MACNRRSQRKRAHLSMARRLAAAPVCDPVEVAPPRMSARTDLVVTPHPLTLNERSIVQGAELRPGETLAVFLTRHGVDLSAGDWAVTIGGAQVPRLMWDRVRPRHGHLIECRRLAGKSALRIVALVALTYFTMGMAAPAAGMATGLAGSLGMSAGFASFALNAGAFMLGSMVINKLLPPPKAKAPQYDSTPATYSISGGRNKLRPYEPLGLVFGQPRVVPDFAAQPYAWFEGDDQFQYVRLHAGINCGEVSDLKVGTTAIESFAGVTVSQAGFPGQTASKLLDWSNVDTIGGGTLESPTDDSGPGAWVTRTSSADTVKLAVDVSASLYAMSNDGKMKEAELQFEAQYRLLPDGPWTPLLGGTLTMLSKSTKPLRRSYESPQLNAGQYEVRLRKLTKTITSPSSANTLDWLTLKSYQLDNTNYASHPHVGIRIKASGQLSGALDEVSWLAKQAAAPVWTSSGWVDTPGTRNPGAHLLQFARGIYDTEGRLMAGMGLPDSQIDIEGLKLFMLHCAEKQYTFDHMFTSMVSCLDLMEAIAAAGLGSISYHPGRLSVIWARDDQPLEAVVNMGNIKKGSFRVDYATRESAEEIEIAWVDRDDGWRDRTLRIKAPGVEMPRDTARLAPLGVTTAAGGLRSGRFTMAQNIYQRKSVVWDMDLEHLTFRRWSLIALSHDMTQWGAGGRLKAANTAGGVVTLVLDDVVKAYTGVSSWYVGLRVPGAQGYQVMAVQPFTEDTHTLTLVQPWPAGLALPGSDGKPVHDTLWIFDFKSQPGQRLRVTSIEPANGMTGARITAVPEGPEFWNYVATGQYEAPPLPPAAAPLVASNVQVTQDRLGLNYDARSQLTVTFDVTGPYDHAQVWGALSGHTLELLGETRTTRFGDWTIDLEGNYDIEVRPYDALGRLGQMAGLVYAATIDPLTSGARFIKLRATSLIFRVPQSGSGVVSPSSITLNLDRGGAGLVAPANWTTLPATTLGGSGDERSLAYLDMPGDVLQVNVSVEQDGKLYIDTLTIVKLYDGADAPETVKDLTPPPMVENFTALAGLASVVCFWDAPSYTVGHGPAKTNIYGAKRAAGAPAPVFADAQRVAEPSGPPGGFSSDPRTTWHLWAKHETVDGVESLVPAGGEHGVVAITTAIGGQDIGDRVIEAENLADGALPQKLAGVQRFDSITVRGTGLNGSYGGHGQMFIRDVHKGDTITRGFTVRIFVRATHEQADDARGWDTYGGATGGGYVPQLEMAAYLNGLGDDRVVMIASYDAVSFDSPGDVLRLALKRLGASPAIDGARGADRFQYAFVGIPGLGQGNGLEMLKPSTPGLPPAEVACFWLDNTILGSGSTINGLTLLSGDYFVDGTMEARHLKSQTITAGSGVFAEGAITRFALGAGSVDDAVILNLSAAKLTAGDGTIGGRLKSANYSSGAAGWIIYPDGGAEFNNITVRNSTTTGTIVAGAGTIGGINITPFSLYNTGFISAVSGFALGSDGTAEFNSGVTFRGALDVGGNSGQRTKITNAGVQVFNASNVEVITLGNY
tara:strand:- start:1832 stop:6400 length:4569 start_codon:yes stop_codon:yes gene_type:complete